ncbi:MAG: hypothetical protein RQ982_08700 [Gammaproteobacteria bacterium]|nr:hypothetical protein [Gammaproteobacteria bacterium]
MLEIDGIPPKLINQLCEDLICQQYCYHDKLIQEVDILFIKVNWRWHQLYFDSGIVFWRMQSEPPSLIKQPANSPFAYPLIDIGEKYGLKDCFITDCITEPLVEGARVTLVFDDRGSLIITHSDNRTRLQFNRA